MLNKNKYFSIVAKKWEIIDWKLTYTGSDSFCSLDKAQKAFISVIF